MRKLFQLLGLMNEEQAHSPVNKEGKLVAFNDKNNTNKEQHNRNVDSEVKKEFEELDEEFVYNFTREGGKFMFCLSKRSLLLNLNRVLKDNNWDNVFINESDINDLLERNKDQNHTYKNADVFISTCDNLVAFNGRIMVSSNQCKNLNFSELPVNHIIIANHSQIVKNLGEGLRRINSKYFKNLPSKITTLKNMNTARNSGTSKNIYVFLLEDY